MGATHPERAWGAGGGGAAGDGAAGVGSDGAPGEAPASPLLPAEVSGDASGATRASGGAAAVRVPKGAYIDWKIPIAKIL